MHAFIGVSLLTQSRTWYVPDSDHLPPRRNSISLLRFLPQYFAHRDRPQKEIKGGGITRPNGKPAGSVRVDGDPLPVAVVELGLGVGLVAMEVK